MASTSEIAEVELGVHEEAIDEVNATGDVTGSSCSDESVAKKAVKLATPPDLCYSPVPDGKSGNMQLPRECVYCRHKFECHKDSNEGKGLRVFKYSNGLKYLTQTPKPPKVIEVTQI